jgi:hypothetical protein
MALFNTDMFKVLFRLFQGAKTPSRHRSGGKRPTRQWSSLGRMHGGELLEVRSVPSANPIVANAVPVSGFEGAPLVNVPVAAFTAGNGSEPAANFQSIILWGDGSSSAGTVVESNNTYVVFGSHTYADISDQPVVVGIQDTTSASAPALVTDTAKIAPLLPDGTQGTVDQRFVYEYLKDVLQRPISMDEVNYWTAQYEKNHDDPQTLSSIVIEATPPYEYRRDEIDSAYKTYLHRPADKAGEDYYLSQVNKSQGVRTSQGVERRTSAALINSDEYFYQRSGGTIDGFINAVFEDALKRPVDPQSLAFFEFQLTHGMTRLDFAISVLNSKEAVTLNINGLFERYLGRPVDPYGLQTFLVTSDYDSGYGTETNTETLLDSSEFYDRAVGLPLDTPHVV